MSVLTPGEFLLGWKSSSSFALMIPQRPEFCGLHSIVCLIFTNLKILVRGANIISQAFCPVLFQSFLCITSCHLQTIHVEFGFETLSLVKVIVVLNHTETDNKQLQMLNSLNRGKRLNELIDSTGERSQPGQLASFSGFVFAFQ